MPQGPTARNVRSEATTARGLPFQHSPLAIAPHFSRFQGLTGGNNWGEKSWFLQKEDIRLEGKWCSHGFIPQRDRVYWALSQRPSRRSDYT
jgi:hypothetical protein